MGVQLIERQREARNEGVDKVAHLLAHPGFQHRLEAFASRFKLPVAGVDLLQTLGIGAEGVGILDQSGQLAILGCRIEQRAKVLNQFRR